MEKKIDTKDLKENVSTLLEKSTDLTDRVEALEKPVGAQNSASCQENRIQIELLQPHGKYIFRKTLIGKLRLFGLIKIILLISLYDSDQK